MVDWKIFILICVLSYVHLEAPTSINLDETPELNIAIEDFVNTLQVNYTKELISPHQYIKIKTNPSVSDNPAQMFLGFEPNQPRKTAKFISEKNGENVIYLNTNYILNKDNFYVTMKCPQFCGYTITFEFVENIEIEKGGSSYSYLTYSQNKDNKVILKRVQKEEEEDIVSIVWTGGASEIEKMQINYIIPNQTTKDIKVNGQLYNGQVATFNEADYPYEEGAYYEITISSALNTYVTISARAINQVKFIYPNDPAVSGYIDTSIIPYECFNFEPTTTPGIEYIYDVSVLAKGNPIEVFFINEKTSEEYPELARTINVQDSFILSSQDEAGKYICIRPKIGTTAIYSIQITDLTNLNTKGQFNQVKINGIPYKHHLFMNQYIYFRKESFVDIKQETNFNLRAISGEPEMYIHRCTTFPVCDYTKESMAEYISKREIRIPHDVNDFFSYVSKSRVGDSAMSSDQQVIVVKCGENYNCEFEVSFYELSDRLNLKPNNRFSQYIIPSETDQYQFHISDTNIKSLTINIFSFSGDSFITNFKGPNSEAEYKNYIVGNKQMIEYTKNAENDLIGDFSFDVVSRTSSYYSVFYTPIYDSQSNESIKNINMSSGEVILETIKFKEEKEKIFTFPHRYKQTLYPFIVSFFSINCKISVTINERSIIPVDDLFQDVITTEKEEFKQDSFSYLVHVNEMDQTGDNEQMCMFFVSNDEIFESSDIIISEMNPIQFTIKKDVPKIRYVYPHPKKAGNIVANFVIEDEIPMDISIEVEDEKVIDYTFSKNRQITIDQSNFQDCNDNYICKVVFIISFHTTTEQALENGIMYELLVKSQNELPSFLKKSMIREDVTFNKVKAFYVTDIVKNEEGEINVNFNRGSGEVFAKIIQKENSEEDPNYKGRYKLPNITDSNILTMNQFTKKLSYTKEQTSKCIEGCLLLLGISSKDQYYASSTETDQYYLDYSVYLRVNSNEDKKRIVDVPVNEVISGSLSSTISQNYYHYYTLYVPSNSTKLVIEAKCTSCNILVTYGTDLPSAQTREWSFIVSGEGIYTIFNSDGPIGGVSLKDKLFTFAIGTNILDQIDSSQYTLRFRTPKIDYPDIIELNADQEIYCELIETNQNYCDFIIPLRVYDFVDNINVHALSDQSSDLTIYAKLYDLQDFDKLSGNEMKKELPREGNCLYDSASQLQTDYLSIKIDNTQTEQYLLVSVKGTKAQLIKFVSSFRTNFNETLAKSGTVQLFHIEKTEEKLNIIIPEDKAYTHYFTLISGRGHVQFENDDFSYFMSSYGETFSLKNKLGSKKNKLVLKAFNELTFVYYYTVTSESESFEEIKEGKNYKFYYTEDLPAQYYAKIGNINEPIMASFKLKDITTSSTSETKEIQIIGYTTDSVSIFGRLKDKDYKMNLSDKIEGNYDSAMSIGTVVFTPEQISKGLTNENEKYIYIEVKKKKESQQFLNFYGSVSIFPINNKERTAVQGDYIVGSFHKDQKDPITYLIKRTENIFNLLKFDISMNSDKMDFAYSSITDTDITKNSTNLTINSIKEELGKTTIIFEMEKKTNNTIKLSFFPKKDEVVSESNSFFYAFKYNEGQSFPNYTITNKELTVFKEIKDDIASIQVQVNDIFKNDGIVIPCQYHLKLFPSTTKYSVNSIINPKDFLYSYTYNVKEKEEIEKFNFTATNIAEGTYYISVIAAINENNDMFSYDSSSVTIIFPKKESKGLSVTIIIVVCVSCLIVILGILFLIYKVIKRKNPTEEVIKSTFNGEINTGLLSKEDEKSFN